MAESAGSRSSIYKHMVRGSTWAVALRWGVRGIGVVSVAILARLLDPDAFGVAAMGAVTIGFIGTFSEIGVQMLLIREQDAGREECDTAWTLKILQGVFIAVVLMVVAPLAANYFDDQRVIAVTYVLAFGAIFEGAQNIGMVLARKELDFARDFRFNLYVRLIDFVLTVGLAIALRSYWALVIGRVLASVVSVPLSFMMHSYRPRFSLARVKKYLRFATSMIPLRFGRFLSGKVDVLVVGGFAGTNQLGVYNVASELSSMLTHEILAPLGRGLMPNYAKLNHDPIELAKAYSHVLRVAAIVMFPIGFGLSVLADDFVHLLLGNQWDAAVPLVQMLALSGMLAGLMHLMSNQILIVSGHERRSAILMWARLAVLIPIVVLAAQRWGVEGVAAGRILGSAIAFPLVVWVLTRSIPLSAGGVIAALWRPLLAALAMAWVVNWLNTRIDIVLLVDVLLKVGAGAITYLLLLLLLWTLSGRPPGIEQVALDFVAARRRPTA